MAGETTLTIRGNLTADPELKVLDSGACVTNFNVASTPRYYAREAGQWRDGDPIFMRCSAWRALAENITASLHKGTRVVVTGRLKQRTYETGEGEHRTVMELEVDDIGPSLQWATATVTKTNGNSRSPATTHGSYGASGGFGAPPADHWASAPAAPTGGQDPAPPF